MMKLTLHGAFSFLANFWSSQKTGRGQIQLPTKKNPKPQNPLKNPNQTPQKERNEWVISLMFLLQFLEKYCEKIEQKLISKLY